MDLREYLKTIGKSRWAAFAKSCGTSSGYLEQVAGGHRRAGPELAVSIERESKGAVRCEDLRPDVDWAYLRSTKPKKRVA